VRHGEIGDDAAGLIRHDTRDLSGPGHGLTFLSAIDLSARLPRNGFRSAQSKIDSMPHRTGAHGNAPAESEGLQIDSSTAGVDDRILSRAAAWPPAIAPMPPLLFLQPPPCA
jgi:hypothetical protein